MKRLPHSLAAFLLTLGSAAAHATAPDGPADLPTVDELLPRLSRLAALFRDEALSFTCNETITYSGHGLMSGREKFAYFYRNTERGLEDYRTQTGLHADPKNPRQAYPMYPPIYLHSVHLWVFAFKESRWKHHEYRILGEDTVLDRRAVMISFDPIPPHREKINDWFATVWVDPETLQILKVEAYSPIDQARIQRLEKHLKTGHGKGRDYMIQRIVTLYEEEMNGMRFPTRVEIETTRHRVKGESPGNMRVHGKKLVEVSQVYTKFRFFQVRTAEEIRTFLEPDAVPPNQ